MPRKRRPPWIGEINGVAYAFWYDPETRRTRRFSLAVPYADEDATNEAFAFWLTLKPLTQGDYLTAGQALEIYKDEHVFADKPDGMPKVMDRERLYSERRDGEPTGIIPNLNAHFGLLQARDIGEFDVTAYCEKRRAGKIGRPAKNSTIRRELGALIAAFNLCSRKKGPDGTYLIPRDEIPVIPLPDRGAPRDRWLRPAEAEALLKASMREHAPRLGQYTRCYLFIKIGLATAARRKSIERLSVFQVDLDAKQIDFNEPGRQRTRKRRSVVPISENLFPVLRSAYEHAIATGSDWILGHPGEIRSTFENAVAYAAEHYGLDPTGINRHTLRHTYGTWAAQSGVDMWKIAGVMGDTLATVERNYAKHHPDYLRDAVNFELTDILGGEPQT